MTKRRAALETMVGDLRLAFDRSFARPPQTAYNDRQDFLAVRAGGGRFALRVSDLSGLERRRKIVALPSSDPALSGLAGVRGRLVPVYSLALLISSGVTVKEESDWLAVCGNDEPVGLSFSEVEGHLRLRASDLWRPSDNAESGNGSRYMREALKFGAEVRYVLNVPAILEAIRDRVGAANT